MLKQFQNQDKKTNPTFPPQSTYELQAAQYVIRFHQFKDAPFKEVRCKHSGRRVIDCYTRNELFISTDLSLKQTITLCEDVSANDCTSLSSFLTEKNADFQPYYFYNARLRFGD